ncbi:MAG: PAS domain S-box protein, partial [Thermodesulfobacteriota bacterium]|nr:PAS domain S-box protein [Thermodesulfobacteriota bacterium]
MEKTISKVLLIDDSFEHVSFVEHTIKEVFPQISIDTALSLSDLHKHLQKNHYSLILLKCTLKWGTARDIVTSLHNEGHESPVVVLGDCEREEEAVQLLRQGAYDYILKTEKFTTALPVVMEAVFQKFREGREKKQLELQLKNSEKMYRSLIESMHDGVCMVNRDFQIVLTNQSLLNHLGDGTDEVLGKRCYEILQNSSNPCEGKDHPCPTREVLKTGKPASVTHSHISSDGDIVFEEMNAYPIFSEEGEITHVVEVLRDITERKKMEEQILKQEKLSVLIEMAGATAHELNQPLTVMLPMLEQALSKVSEQNSLFNDLSVIEKQCLRMADLVRKISEITTYKTKPYVGDIQIIDITKASQPSKITEQKLLASLLTALDDYSVIITDESGLITYFNKYSEELLGYPAQEIVFKKDVLFFSKKEPRLKTISESRAPALEKGYCKRRKTVISQAGKEIDIDLCFAPLKDDQYRITGFLGIAQ